MASTPLYAPTRRAPRVVAPKARCVTATSVMIEAAEKQGYADGLADQSYLPRLNYRTSEEWLAWLRNWRAGQRERRRRAAA